MPINQVQEGLTQFYNMLTYFFKESHRVHACPAFFMTQQRKDWTHQPRSAVDTYTEDIELYK